MPKTYDPHSFDLAELFLQDEPLLNRRGERNDRGSHSEISESRVNVSLPDGARKMPENLLLKWGSVKGWDDLSEKSQAILERYYADGVPMSAAMDKPDDERRAILCELIDQLDGEIHNDWTGKRMTKDEAKKYVLEYR